MEIQEEILQQVLDMRDERRISYSELADIFLGDKSLGDKLRARIRTYKRNHSIHTILDPVGKLFGDALVIPELPTLVIGDTHAPYQNKAVLLKALRLAKKQGVTQVVHAGDLIDAASYNSQAKGQVVTPIQTDIEHARSILYTIISMGFKIYLVPGNHDLYYTKKNDITFARFIQETVLNNLYIDSIETTEYDYLYYGNYAVIGHLSSGYDMVPGKVAAQIADKYTMHALVGHDHLRGAIQGSTGKWGISIGAMFVPDSFWYKSRAYNTFPDTQVGFCIIRDKKIYQYDEDLNERIYK